MGSGASELASDMELGWGPPPQPCPSLVTCSRNPSSNKYPGDPKDQWGC